MISLVVDGKKHVGFQMMGGWFNLAIKPWGQT